MIRRAYEAIRKRMGYPKDITAQEGRQTQNEKGIIRYLRGSYMDTIKPKPQRGVRLQPLDVIDGFQVRPGFYNRDGAAATPNGVSFKIGRAHV